MRNRVNSIALYPTLCSCVQNISSHHLCDDVWSLVAPRLLVIGEHPTVCCTRLGHSSSFPEPSSLSIIKIPNLNLWARKHCVRHKQKFTFCTKGRNFFVMDKHLILFHPSGRFSDIVGSLWLRLWERSHWNNPANCEAGRPSGDGGGPLTVRYCSVPIPSQPAMCRQRRGQERKYCAKTQRNSKPLQTPPNHPENCLF